MAVFSKYINQGTGIMTIYAGTHVISEISDCKHLLEHELNTLADEVLTDLGYINANERYFTN